MPNAVYQPNKGDISFVAHARSRPGMYIGGVNGRGLFHMVDLLISEQLRTLGAQVSRVRMILEAEGLISLDFHGVIPALFPIGTCFPQLSCGVPNISSFALPAAYAKRFDFEVVQPDYHWRQHFVRGFATNPPELLAPTSENVVRFQMLPDRELFRKDARVAFHVACGRFQIQAIFNTATVFEVVDHATGNKREYHYAAGLRDYMEEVEHALIYGVAWMSTFHLKLEEGGESAEAVIFERGDGPRLVQSFVNGERWMEEGSHITGLERGFAEVARLFESSKGLEPPLAPFDPLHGYTVLLAMQLDGTQLMGSWRRHVGGARAEDLVYRMITTQLPPLKRRRAEEIAAGAKTVATRA